jgi:glutamate N-acetyltransferase/amino-acid N-acetyltransferase
MPSRAAAAQAIMTTDTFPKLATRRATIDGVTVTLNGIAKGAGMIAPDMATMLSFVFTDAALPQGVLQALLSAGTATSFNCVTVDGDTSTSDTLMLFATGEAGNAAMSDAGDPRLSGFRAALDDLLVDLAQLVARDGEGARKFVTVRVKGATSDASAHRIAMSIANSPLVKTAIAGEDANWGRVVMAVGKAGEPADRDRLAIWFGDVRVARAGARDPDYSEAAASAVMRESDVTVRVDLGLGEGSARVWTCDLTKLYIEINGDYRS